MALTPIPLTNFYKVTKHKAGITGQIQLYMETYLLTCKKQSNKNSTVMLKLNSNKTNESQRLAEQHYATNSQ